MTQALSIEAQLGQARAKLQRLISEGSPFIELQQQRVEVLKARLATGQ